MGMTAKEMVHNKELFAKMGFNDQVQEEAASKKFLRTSKLAAYRKNLEAAQKK
jgi:hypothetical protein